jgi:predicted Rossmann fold nucleotide-binding protein DprA/Smf involved in DNA uptake
MTMAGKIRMNERETIIKDGIKLPQGMKGSARLEAGTARLPRAGMLGFICSIQCPGSIVIRALDAARELRDANVCVIGGFHSPMERECLEILLRGKQRVGYCPAHGLDSLVLTESQSAATKEGRLVLIAAFPPELRKATVEQAVQRNDLIADLATALWVPHAAPGGKAWATVRKSLAAGKPVYTFDDPANHELLDVGAKRLSAPAIASLLEAIAQAAKD